MVIYWCHIPNSKTCPRHVWLQYNIKSSHLFGHIFVQNSVGSLVLYNRLYFIQSPQLFHFIWVKICSHIHLFLLSNHFLQTPQIYLDFTQSFPLSKSKLLYNISLIKHSLRDLFQLLLLLFYVFKAGDHFVIASLIIN